MLLIVKYAFIWLAFTSASLSGRTSSSSFKYVHPERHSDLPQRQRAEARQLDITKLNYLICNLRLNQSTILYLLASR